MPEDSITLSQPIAAAMQLRLPGTAGRVARKMRYIDQVAPRFRAGGPIRDVPEMRYPTIPTFHKWQLRIGGRVQHLGQSQCWDLCADR